ncbi:PhzF family phenazine biosynthesis protein [Ktedonosporobacter rubrisoli]|uniref:PhzF family phenazine biosynthesis protein n=1 Tax=Ktedonosporobacter rubrisoli TaxID=2509675 RepID=A0A4P6JLR5_KTERU|nr:PhzF family phenazine biosynthesis protein [Ktedonosporobacter rubrisoli]QBD76168.1 PhzF family phenazine biosynthesis protein [Ktedonosporobacter rubrisoli]
MTQQSERPRVRFAMIDVFAGEPLAGNPMAVIADAQTLDLKHMQLISREFNQSESTFLLPPTRPGADWRLRSFTITGAEVFGVGHHTLGAWWWLAESGQLALSAPSNTFVQEVGESLLPIEILAKNGRPLAIRMQQEPPVFGAIYKDHRELSAALNIPESSFTLEQLPAQVVSTGVAHLMVPIKSREVLWQVRPDSQGLLAILKSCGAEGCYLFSLDPIDSVATAHARFFNPTVGIAEDPATGSAAGPLACYLVAQGRAEEGKPLFIEQGHVMGRPSLIEVQVQGSEVKIAGQGVIVAEGNLYPSL